MLGFRDILVRIRIKLRIQLRIQLRIRLLSSMTLRMLKKNIFFLVTYRYIIFSLKN